MTGRERAQELVTQALSLAEAGDEAAAAALYLQAHAADPEWSVPPYNLGLQFKYQLRWEESLHMNRVASALAPDDEAANWNWGIAATALGHWTEARAAWAACGINVPEGDGAPEFDWGQVPVRLNADGEGEVVWASRLDPARVIVRSVPIPWSNFHWGDELLIDGAPEGARTVNGVEYPVFNALTLLRHSGIQTFVVEFGHLDETNISALDVVAQAAGGAFEHWRSSTRTLCRACSLGTPHEHGGPVAEPGHPHGGLAARDDAQARAVIEKWLADTPGADVVRWYRADVN